MPAVTLSTVLQAIVSIWIVPKFPECEVFYFLWVFPNDIVYAKFQTHIERILKDKLIWCIKLDNTWYDVCTNVSASHKSITIYDIVLVNTPYFVIISYKIIYAWYQIIRYLN